ncbi:MAG: protein kinase [Planctomycetes bacterium]|nr:protein kinase [Planctomycetota bacterium]
MDARERQFAEIAVELGFVTAADIDGCARSGSSKPLGQQFLERGAMTFEQVSRVIEVQKQRYLELGGWTPPPSRPAGRVTTARKIDLFGQLAVARGYITAAQLDECIAELQEASARGAKIAIGQILVRRRYLSTERFLEILKLQERSLLRCEKCGTRYEGATPQDPRCSVCGGPLGVTTTQIEATVRAEGQPAVTPFGAGPAPQVEPGEVLGRYEILEEIGRGGMGVVFKARHRDLRRIVAVKVLRGEGADETGVKRFYREARTAASLRHGNIVAVHDVGVERGLHYIAMDWIEGERLDALLGQNRIGLREGARILGQVARALHFAHQASIVHRDVKPGNVMIDRTGRAFVLDFGLAKTMGGATMLTRTGSFLGTPFYMSPEQVEGNTSTVGPRSDIYALGVMAFEVATGEVPFTGSTAMEVYQKIVNAPAPRPSSRQPGLPAEFDRLVLRALEKDPRKRHATAEEFADELVRVARPEGA